MLQSFRKKLWNLYKNCGIEVQDVEVNIEGEKFKAVDHSGQRDHRGTERKDCR